MARKDDTSNSFHIRCERFFRLYEHWYFATREGKAIGPYDSKEQAHIGAVEYIHFVTSAPQRVVKSLFKEKPMIA